MLNTPTSNIPFQQKIVQVHTVSPTLMWGLTADPPTNSVSIPNSAIVTNNSYGSANTFDFNYITVTGNATVGNISGISATTAVAAAYPGPTFTGPAGYGGEIVRTTNGGWSWTKVTTATQFSGAGAFCNWVHMFNATTGVALGNPTTVGGAFEVLRTTNGGLTWTPVTGVPAALLNECGQPGAFFASDATPGMLWTGLASSIETNPVRVFKTSDYGQTWTVSSPVPNIVGAVSHLAFKSNNRDGLAYGFTKTNGVPSAVNVARTADGGQTWAAITPIRAPYSSFFHNSLDAVGNLYYSTGPRDVVSPASLGPEDFGTSFSTDGINWSYLSSFNNSLYNPGYLFCMDLIPLGLTTTVVGYGGLYTNPSGVGGVYRFSPSVANATRDAARQSTLTVAPNPSTSGVFSVSLGSPLKTSAQLTVTDALGRPVAVQTLTATSISSTTIQLDLHNEKPGVYTLQVRTDAGIATQKVVIE